MIRLMILEDLPNCYTDFTEHSRWQIAKWVDQMVESGKSLTYLLF